MALDDRAGRIGPRLGRRRVVSPEANDRIGRRLGWLLPTTISGKVECLVRSPTETRARGETPNPSPRTEPRTVGSWPARGTERKVQGLSLIKSRPLGCSTVVAPERRPAGTRARVNAGNGSSRRRRRGDGMTTPRVLSTAAPNLRSTAWRHKKVASLPGAKGFGAAGPASHLLLGRYSCGLGSPAQQNEVLLWQTLQAEPGKKQT